MNLSHKPHWKLPLHFLIFLSLLQLHCICSYPTPMKCMDTTHFCTSFLAFKPQPNQTLPIIKSMFDVLPSDNIFEGNGWGCIFIRKNYSCVDGVKNYVSNSTFTMKCNEGFMYDLVMDAYDGLALLPNTNHWARKGVVMSLRLFCLCSCGPWNYLASYVIRDGDNVESLASKFRVSMDSTEAVNGIENLDNVPVGSLYYMPLDLVPGQPYLWKNNTPPVPIPSLSVDNLSADQVNHKARVPSGRMIGGLGVGLALIILSLILRVSLTLRSSSCIAEAINHPKDVEGKISHKFHIHGNPCLFCGFRRHISAKTKDQKQDDGESSNHHITIPEASSNQPSYWTLKYTHECLDSGSVISYIADI